jgi:hypothetical protein
MTRLILIAALLVGCGEATQKQAKVEPRLFGPGDCEMKWLPHPDGVTECLWETHHLTLRKMRIRVVRCQERDGRIEI